VLLGRRLGLCRLTEIRSPAIADGALDIPVTPSWTCRDQTRVIQMTFYTYPQPVLNPQLEHV
jgi:hypothetical protein